MKRYISLLIKLLLLGVFVFASAGANAQDERQRTVATIVQDVLAQLPSATQVELDREMADIANSAPESVIILTQMLVPAQEGQNAKVEYALNGIVNYVSRPGNEAYVAKVNEGLREGIYACTDVPNKAFLLTQLGQIASSEDVAVFTDFASDENLGSVAIGVLINVPGSEEAIMELFKTSSASKALLAYAAAEKGLTEAEPYLLKWVKEAAQDADKAAYIRALAACGTKASLKLLKQESLYDYSLLLRRVAEQGDTKTALSAAKKLLKHSETHIRCSALESIIAINGSDAVNYVVSALKDQDKEYRAAALDYASPFKENAALVQAIKQVFPKLSDDAKADVVYWAGRVKATSFSDEVLSCIPASGAAATDLAFAAIATAGKLGGDKAADALVGQLSGSKELAEAAYKALLSFEGVLQSRLAETLGQGGQQTLLAIKLASERRMKGLSDQVFSLLDSENEEISNAAYDALWGVVSLEDCARLAEILETRPATRTAAIQKAMCHALQSIPAKEQYAKVAAMLSETNNPALYYPALAQAATKEAIEQLAQAASAGSEEAFAALMTVNNPAAADVLMTLAKSNPEKAEVALSRFTELISSLKDGVRLPKYAEVLEMAPGAELQNKVLGYLADIPVMASLSIASQYLDAPQTAYQAANAVRQIAAKTAYDLDYAVLKPALEKAMEIYAATGDADDGYAVDEIKKLLSGLEPPAEKFVLPAEEAKAGFEVLFDGTDLSNWTGDKVGYSVVNGTILVTASYGTSGNLYTQKEYKDFVFRFEFCFLEPGVNNGVGVRTPTGVDAAYYGMCEVQILDHDDPIYKNLREYQVHGSAYGIIPARRVVHKPLGEWNTQEIKVVGDHITVTLNGEVILDGNLREACSGHNVDPEGGKTNPYTVDHRNHPGMFNEKGHISFCGHGAGLKLRNIRVLELK